MFGANKQFLLFFIARTIELVGSGMVSVFSSPALRGIVPDLVDEIYIQ
ncbi:hypothetical protein [Actinomyces vulturis]|nr:hypothetical protein [Actinomyces vulturis]